MTSRSGVPLLQRLAWNATGWLHAQQRAYQPLAPLAVAAAAAAEASKKVMDVEKLLGCTPEEVTDIWLKFHSDDTKNMVGSTMTREEHAVFTARAKESPLFALPLAKPGGGYLTLVSQCQAPFVLLTTLEEYRRVPQFQAPFVLLTTLGEYRSKGSTAPAHMAITIYSELVESKGLALVRGDVVEVANIDAREARLVQELIRAFYTHDEDYQMVHAFNHAPAKFDFAAVLAKLGHGGDAEKK
ncbi:hypothetical protein FOA52_003945 [Chlamydomonas sp. UWO 241]|nr:hypothetical protein FOA52_003945 [Chlamydomonas sp. UWO 241]